MSIFCKRLSSTLSTVFRGNAFEERSVSVLQKLSMSLLKVGGKSDGGVDLQGWWFVPISPHRLKEQQRITGEVIKTWKAPDGTIRRRLRILGQCKAEQKKIGPRYIRELEGVLARHESSLNNPVIGLLVSESEFSRSTLLTAYSSRLPLFLLQLPPEPETSENVEPDKIGSAVWNPALGGLFKGDLEIRWERSAHCLEGRPTLWWGRDNRVEGWIPPGNDELFSPQSNTPP
ncbi:hypothetical protein Clacol_004647 [Clathrus columnatus]|uniref:Uncharacterized protein n=1 Tax=Clathrus columnatus TaxID=1419009 RepID=A0AAV5ABM0_9AGAM|nr:hypothetical protein Clacol_004647 [Clathrus columnatus]